MRSKGFNVVYGFEIEGCFNNDVLQCYSVPPYHSPEKYGDTNFWRYEKDGSLWRSAKFRNEVLIEFTTNKLNNKKDFFKALTEFRKVIFKNKPLGDCMDFNNSMGCHIHLSTKEHKNYFSNLFSLEDYVKVREKFFDLVKKSSILSEDTKKAVLYQYSRKHSQLITKYNFDEDDRYIEFNKISEIEDCAGLEWRGFNLCGCKNWGEFEELFKIAFNTLEILLKLRFSKKKKFKRFMLDLGFKEIELEFKDNEEVIIYEEDLSVMHPSEDHIWFYLYSGGNIS